MTSPQNEKNTRLIDLIKDIPKEHALAAWNHVLICKITDAGISHLHKQMKDAGLIKDKENNVIS